MVPINQDLVERMEQLARQVVDTAPADGNSRPHPSEYWAIVNLARAIVALLPAPVDPDMAAAHRMVREAYPNCASANEHALVRMAFDGIRAGRELEIAREPGQVSVVYPFSWDPTNRAADGNTSKPKPARPTR